MTGGPKRWCSPSTYAKETRSSLLLVDARVGRRHGRGSTAGPAKVARFRTMVPGNDLLMKPGRPIEASESPDRARPGRLLLAVALGAAAIVIALVLRRLS